MPESFKKLVPATGTATTPMDLLEEAELSPEILAYLWFAVDLRMSIIVLGSSKLGKLRYLDALSFFVPQEARVVSISSEHHWTVPHRNWHDAKLDDWNHVLPYLSGAQAKDSDCVFIERLEEPGIMMAPLLMVQGKSVCSTVDWEEDLDKFVQSITSSPPLLHRLHLSAVNIVATVQDVRKTMPEKETSEKFSKPIQKMTLVTEIVGYDHTANRLIVNDPYWWEKAGSGIDDRPYGWFFFSGHSFVYEAGIEIKKLANREMDAEVLRRVDFIRWLFYRKKDKPKQLMDEIAAYRRKPKEVADRCRKELKGVSLPIDRKRKDGSPMPRTKAKLRAV